jgi:hypothetical protein
MTETLFKQVNYTVGALVDFIGLGQIGLPDIQRPFVWPNTKVRDLFDSMYRGYPVGHLLFWQNAFTDDARAIGADSKQKVPSLLIVDGQQRLTSLYAVIRGIPVKREDYSTEHVSIAFNPLLERFEVADAAIRRDKSYIPDISVLWSGKTDLFEVVDAYWSELVTTRPVSDEEKKTMRRNISGLANLLSFPFTALELASTIDEEQVAEIFVRVNSKGTPLNQADFVLTLMSVFWDEGRAQLEGFCRDARVPTTGEASPFNHFIHPSPDQLLRVSVALGFKRARLQYVYSILRGKDLETGDFDAGRRDRQFDILKAAQARVLNIQHWHDFFKAVTQAGYRGGRLISSENALLYSYSLYLIGRTEYGVREPVLRPVIARWFFMASLTGRYTASPESAMEFDLARLREVRTADEFVRALGRVCETALTPDFWTMTLPNELATSAPRSPSLFAYYAALVRLDARGLFSEQRVTDLLDPSVHARRAAAERHHLFPRAHLKRLGITEVREVNQIANYALMEWGDNSEVSDKSPREYVPSLSGRFGAADRGRMYYWHALPDGWEEMAYAEFLSRRRELMAKVIADGYARLAVEGPKGVVEDREAPLVELVGAGETTRVEFKATLRKNLHTGQSDPRIELSWVKTVAAFLNSQGGTLIVGVMDDGTPLGAEEDGFPNEDKMALHVVSVLKERIGAPAMMYVHPRFDDYEGKRVCVVECVPAGSAVFVKDGPAERFFVRAGPSSAELTGKQSLEYMKHRFGR